MYFGTKSYLKSNRNHTAKHAHRKGQKMGLFRRMNKVCSCGVFNSFVVFKVYIYIYIYRPIKKRHVIIIIL